MRTKSQQIINKDNEFVKEMITYDQKYLSLLDLTK